MRPLRSFALICAVCASIALCSRVGSAQHNPAIADARRHGEEADFDAALQAFERAQREGGLSREDVVDLFAERSIIYYALQDEPRMRLDLSCLAALEPDYRFGDAVLPQVRDAFAKLRLEVEPLRLELSLRRDAEKLEISTQYRNPPARLVLSDRVYVRVGTQPWRFAPGRVAIANPERRTVEYYGEAFGPGGALLLANGSRQRPLRFEYDPSEMQARADNSSTLLWILGGAAVLVAGATVLIAVAMSENDHTQLEGPIVR